MPVTRSCAAGRPLQELRQQVRLSTRSAPGQALLRLVEPAVHCLLSLIRRHGKGGREGPAYGVDDLEPACREWCRELLVGPHDDAFEARQRRLGRTAARWHLGPAHLVTASQALGAGLREAAALEFDPVTQRAVTDHVDHLLHYELALVLEGLMPATAPGTGAEMESLLWMAEAVAHRLRNPLAGLSGALQVLFPLIPLKYRPLQVQLLTQINRLDGVVGDLLRFSSPFSARLETVALLPLARELDRSEAARGLELEIRGGGEALADGKLLKQALEELLRNAREAGAQRVDIKVRPGGLDICDDGPGPPLGSGEELFLPFYTPGLHAWGMGLFNARRWIEAMGGTLERCPTCLKGAGFRISLPPPPPPGDSASPADTGGHIG